MYLSTLVDCIYSRAFFLCDTHSVIDLFMDWTQFAVLRAHIIPSLSQPNLNDVAVGQRDFRFSLMDTTDRK